jgi:hypothetical protein
MLASWPDQYSNTGETGSIYLHYTEVGTSKLLQEK